MSKELLNKLDKVISALEKCQSFSIGVTSQSVVPIGYSSSDTRSKMLDDRLKLAKSPKDVYEAIIKVYPNERPGLFESDANHCRFIVRSEYDCWQEYNDRVYSTISAILVDNGWDIEYSTIDAYNGDKDISYTISRLDSRDFSISLDSIREMAREDAETYRAEGMNPNNLSKKELAEKCYKERVKYPSDEAKKAFVDEFLANFSAEDAYVLYSYWLDKNSNEETHLDILLVSSKKACEKLKALKTSGDIDGDIIRYKINSYSTFIRKPGAREAIKKYKTTI